VRKENVPPLNVNKSRWIMYMSLAATLINHSEVWPEDGSVYELKYVTRNTNNTSQI
jgi:hypothetical protein